MVTLFREKVVTLGERRGSNAREVEVAHQIDVAPSDDRGVFVDLDGLQVAC